jgi:uncharacterized protein (TIGR02391 family)
MIVRELITAAPNADALLALTESELQLVLLGQVRAISDDPVRKMLTFDGAIGDLFYSGHYAQEKRDPVTRAVKRAWKALETAELIEEPDSTNGKAGYRVISAKGRTANTNVDLAAARVRRWLTPDLVHPKLHKACLNAFRTADYDTAVFEAFKTVEAEVRKKGGYDDTDFGVDLMSNAFDPNSGRLTEMSLPKPRRNARQRLFMGAMGDLRNPKGHGDPTITDPQIAIEEIMIASRLLRTIGV